MSLVPLVAANLLLNAAGSFVAGWLFVGLVTGLFRIGTTRTKLLFLSLPFTKILWDLYYGVPATSFLFSSIDPWRLPPGHRTLYLGAGMSYWGPVINVAFSIHDVAGREYSISLPDFFLTWLGHLDARSPLYIFGALCVGSLFLLARRVGEALSFERRRRGDVSRRLVETVHVGRRTVRIYRSDAFDGTPFTGGIFRPYVVFPSKTLCALSHDEYTAVLAHELAHVRYYDLPLTMFVQTIGDVFWFVPGYRFLSRRIDRLRELLADRSAVEGGADAGALASALLRLQTADRPPFVLYSAFMRTPSMLRVRVLALTRAERPKPPRWGWNYALGRLVITTWTVGGVLLARFGGNG